MRRRGGTGHPVLLAWRQRRRLAVMRPRAWGLGLVLASAACANDTANDNGQRIGTDGCIISVPESQITEILAKGGIVIRVPSASSKGCKAGL